MFLAKKIKIVSVISVMIFAMACKKNSTTQSNTNNIVPYVPVNVTIYPGDPQYFKIQTAGGWIYYNTAGVNGIIIYRKTPTEFVTIERTSTYLPNDAAALAKVQSDNFTLKDTVSGSKWQIIDGAVTNGPATYALKRYQNTYDGNALKITN